MMGTLLTVSLPVQAERVRYQDIYLINNRVCRKCVYQIQDHRHVLLENRQGERVIVRPDEIVGIDAHPFWRKFMQHVGENNGLAGQVITSPGYDPLQAVKNKQRLDP